MITNLPKDLYPRLVAAKRYMDEHYGAPMNLDELSRKALLSRFHFHRLFCRVYRKTPHRYLTLKRLDKAKELLAQNHPITDVCVQVGFESPASFSLLFKKESGCAPGQYRTNAVEKKQKTLEQPRAFIPHCFIESWRLDDGE